jgi:exopolysaccharide production protein ExoZ
MSDSAGVTGRSPIITLRKYGETDFITGLRAYAALAVVMVHTGALSEFGRIGRTISETGKHGVAMFFVIAGFSVATSYNQIGAYRPYLVRRVIRIWPVYMVAIIAAFALWHSGVFGPAHFFATQYGGALDAYSLLMHATFLSFLDYRIANGIIGVEWTIPVEVFWYLVIPPIMLRTRHWMHLLGFAAAFLLVHAALRGVFMLAHFKHTNVMAGWMPFAHAPYFLAGVLAYVVRTNTALWPAIDRAAAARFAPAAAVLGLVIVAALPVGDAIKAPLIGLATFALIAFRRSATGGLAWLLENRIVLFFGAISYSLYLVHAPVIGLLKVWQPALTGLPLFASGVAAASLVALVSCLLIEHPANNLGRRLAAPGKAKAGAAA